MNYKKRVKLLKVFLNIIFGITSLILISSLFNFIYIVKEGVSMRHSVLLILSYIFIFVGYLLIIFDMKKILNSILLRNPFNSDNIIYFRTIGYIIFIIGLIDAVINYPNGLNLNFQIMATSYGAIKPIFFLYVVLSILSFILNDVFRMAMEIKDENDLTV